MSESSWYPFIDPDGMTDGQLMWAFVSYGYVLYSASNMISDGSELLLLIPSLAGLVGSCVLPILGAVPDGMMVLFSGLGPDAQNQVQIGVGALAGSTIMLLTATWFMGMLGGRVDMVGGVPQYKPPEGKPKLSAGNWSPFGSGVSVSPLIAENALLMILTSFLYLIIQIPSTMAERAGYDTKKQSEVEHTWACVGAVGCIVCFCGYLLINYRKASKPDGLAENKHIEQVVNAIGNKSASLMAVLSEFWEDQERQGTIVSSQSLLDNMDPDSLRRLKRIILPFFAYYDANNDRTIDYHEFCMLLRDIRLNINKEEQAELFKRADTDGSGYMNFEEFADCVARCAFNMRSLGDQATYSLHPQRAPTFVDSPDDDEEEGEAEDVPADLADLPPDVQQRKIMQRSLLLMGLGTLLVLVFSDPMVDVLSEIGVRTDVSGFYISFILAPLASNASELVAAYAYAQKRTMKSMTISLSTLEGAACMNNTFCLCIFFIVVAWKKLAWQFTAETITIVICELIMGCIALSSKTMTFGIGWFILLLYPLSLFGVYFLENQLGLD
jgi:Ca2+/Na+ antiporter